MRQLAPRIVITGVGLVTPLGADVPTTWANLCAGQSGIQKLDATTFPAAEFASRIAGVVSAPLPADVIPAKTQRQIDRFIVLGWHASQQALQQAGLLSDGGQLPPAVQPRAGVVFGSGVGGLPEIERGVETLRTRGAKRLSPFFIPAMLPNLLSGQVSIAYGLQGPNSCSVTACATGSHSIIEAAHYLASGQADIMLAGGAESCLSPLALAGFAAARALSTNFNNAPTHACRPFDTQRDGFVIAEGAGALVLETEAHAQSRGATVLAYLSGFGASADAFHITQPAPGGAGALRAMGLALHDAGLHPTDVSAISAHATSTPVGDAMEAEAIRTLCPHHPPVTALKSMLGHTLGAAGAIAAAAAVQSLQHQCLPPVQNLTEPDPACVLNLPTTALAGAYQNILVNAFGFGGTNAALLLSRG